MSSYEEELFKERRVNFLIRAGKRCHNKQWVGAPGCVGWPKAFKSSLFSYEQAGWIG